MKTHFHLSKLEKGQVLPIVVFSMFALIAMAALLIDGGMLLSNRRTAQAAADAGALAGAYELCYNTGIDPYDIAEKYAIDNGADDPPLAVPFNGKVKVTATVSTDSFFARALGYDSLPATAEAVAGCIPPAGRYIMPIAWYCRPNIGGATGTASPFSPDLDCLIAPLDWLEIKNYVPGVAGTIIPIDGPHEYKVHTDGTSIVYTDNEGKARPHPYIYVIMDSSPNNPNQNEEIFCKEDFEKVEGFDPDNPPEEYQYAIRCDLDGDGKMDIMAAGSRGWLVLDITKTGTAGTNLLSGWITGGGFKTRKISPHTWLSNADGNRRGLYGDLKTQLGKVIWVPVYNAVCDDTNPCGNPACLAEAHPEGTDWDGVCTNSAGKKPKYHIVTFAPFYLTCVKEKQADNCPGFELFLDKNPQLNPGDINKLSTAEGYFLTNVEKDLDQLENCDVDLGNCVITLVE